MKKETELQIIKESESFIEVKNNEDLEKATLILSRLNVYLDGLIEEKEKVTKPMLLALKNERTRFKPLEEKLESAILKIRIELSRYATEVEKTRVEKEAKISARVEKGTLGAEKAVEKMQNLASVPENTETASGSLKFRPTPRLKIVDAKLIPRQYCEPNEKMIFEALQSGIKVAGAIIEVVQVPVNRR